MNYISGLNIVSEFNLENVTEYLDENSFDQIEDIQDAVPEDDAKSDIVIEKYEYILIEIFIKLTFFYILLIVSNNV